MFFIMGINNARKQLNFDQTVICKVCGRYGHIQVFETYTYLMFFFLPIIKWNRHYYVQMSCCNASCEISAELGKDIKKGNVTYLSEDILHFNSGGYRVHRCQNCGFTTEENFAYCPKCGRPLD